MIGNLNGEVVAGANLYFKKGEEIYAVGIADINGEFKTEVAAGNYEMTVM